VDAQPTVTLTVDPEIQVISLGLGPTEIQLTARVDQEFNVEYGWRFNGPGELVGDTTGPGVFYIPPEKIDGKAAQVDITVEVIDDKGNKTARNVTFTLVPPEPPPTPTPIPTPTPVSPIRIGDMVLKDQQNTIMNPTYEIKPGEPITIEVKILGPSDRNLTIDCTAIRGKVEVEQGEITYTAPDKPGGKDMVTVKAVDSDTGKVIVQKVIKIQMKD
jgi:hypothetical protein